MEVFFYRIILFEETCETSISFGSVLESFILKCFFNIIFQYFL